MSFSWLSPFLKVDSVCKSYLYTGRWRKGVMMVFPTIGLSGQETRDHCLCDGWRRFQTVIHPFAHFPEKSFNACRGKCSE
jgi:hypothetical protein